MGYPRRLGGYLPSNLTISGPISSGAVTSSSTITGTRLIATSAGTGSAAGVAVGATGVGLLESSANLLGFTQGTATSMTLGGGALSLLNGNLLALSGAVYEQGIVSPTALSGDVTDYNPTSLSAASVLRIDPGGAARVINSLAGGGTGRMMTIVNLGTGTNTLTLLHDNGATGTAAMRFYCPNEVSYVIPKFGTARAVYDATRSRWCVIGSVA